MLVLCLNLDWLFIFVGRKPVRGSVPATGTESGSWGAETDGGWAPFIILPLAILWNGISYHHSWQLASELGFLKTEKQAFLAVTGSNHWVVQIRRQRSREIKSLRCSKYWHRWSVWRQVPRILAWCSLVPMDSLTFFVCVQLNKTKPSLVRG